MKALILNNVVVDLSQTVFEVHPNLTWMDAPEGCSTGWELVGDTLQAPAGPSEDEIASSLRSARDKLLAETDWTALSDVTMSTEMAAYRQALRDITTHANWPNLADADWPTKP